MTVGVDAGRPREDDAVQRPEEPDGIRKAPAFVDATDIPSTCENAVIDAVLVDAVAKAGRSYGECHQLAWGLGLPFQSLNFGKVPLANGNIALLQIRVALSHCIF